MHQIRQNARPTIRERREKREPRSERERDDRASPRRRAARSTIAPLVRRSHRANERRGAWSRSSIERRDQRSMIAIDECARLLSDDRAAHRSTSGARPTSALVDRRAARSSDERAHRSHRSIDDRAARRRGEARSSLSLSDLGSLFSLLSLIVGRAFCRIWCIFW